MPADTEVENAKRRILLRRFWETARGFWSGARSSAWLLTFFLVAILVVQVLAQYRLNVWNRDIFDAIEKKEAASVLYQASLFVPIAVAIVVIAVTVIWMRMAIQRRWRGWVTDYLVDRWFAHGRYYHLDLIEGDHKNPEHRLTEDIRVATEAPVDMVGGMIAAILSAVTFIGVLWVVGGSISFDWSGSTVTIPGFLVMAAVAYAVIASSAMVWIGRRYVIASENKSQSEAEFRYALTRLRENGESIALIAGEEEEKYWLTKALGNVITAYREICRQYMRTTVVAQSSFVLAPVIPVILSAPKYLAGTMTLGQVMQAAQAFVTVQTAFNWIVDNYPRLADWTASGRRVGSLIVSLDGLEKAEKEDTWGRIERGDASEGTVLELRDVSVTLDNGTVMVKDADVKIAPGEKVLFVGESGSGKSTLVRAIAGLWPWGQGHICIQKNALMLLMPQKPYIPIGPLSRAVTYPKTPEEVDQDKIKKAIEMVGLGEFVDKLDEEAPWEQTLSGGEKQRVAFARALIQRPDILVMDEATSALDKASQDDIMALIAKELPKTTVVSVGHRPELEGYHDRKIELEHRRGGARIVSDEDLTAKPGRRFGLLRRILRRRKRAQARSDTEHREAA